MTCIAAVAEGGNVWMGADSAGVAGLSLSVRRDPKIYRVGEFLFGFTSSFRMGQLLGYKFSPPLHHSEWDADRYMTTVFIDALRDTVREFAQAEIAAWVVCRIRHQPEVRQLAAGGEALHRRQRKIEARHIDITRDQPEAIGQPGQCAHDAAGGLERAAVVAAFERPVDAHAMARTVHMFNATESTRLQRHTDQRLVNHCGGAATLGYENFSRWHRAPYGDKTRTTTGRVEGFRSSY